MKVYEIVVGNYLDDSNYSKLVLSEEPLTMENANINAIAQIKPDWEKIVSVKVPQLIMNAWTEEEWNEMSDIKNKYF